MGSCVEFRIDFGVESARTLKCWFEASRLMGARAFWGFLICMRSVVGRTWCFQLLIVPWIVSIGCFDWFSHYLRILIIFGLLVVVPGGASFLLSSSVAFDEFMQFSV